ASVVPRIHPDLCDVIEKDRIGALSSVDEFGPQPSEVAVGMFQPCQWTIGVGQTGFEGEEGTEAAVRLRVQARAPTDRGQYGRHLTDCRLRVSDLVRDHLCAEIISPPCLRAESETAHG